MMTELEKMQRAKMYIDKLANGINPIDDTNVPEDDTINNIRLSRCLFYVSEVLGRVIENGGNVECKKTPKENFNISFDEIQKFEFSEIPIAVSEIAKRINALVRNVNMKKMTHKHLSDWLISVEMLRMEQLPNGKTSKAPTKSGNELGIITEMRTGLRGNYTAILYNRNAQQFIIDNIDAVIAKMREK